MLDQEEAIATEDAPVQQGAPAPQGDDNAVGASAPAQQSAIPTGDDNSMPEGPIQEQQAPGPPKRFGPMGRLVSLLMGEGAVPPQVLIQAGQQIDPENGMSGSDKNIMVIEDAARRGGPDEAMAMGQANRVAYNSKQAFAYAALNGNQQANKPPDVQAAVNAANQAAEHVLDGSNAHFTATEGGITATVKDARGQLQNFNLTPDQFRRYLNVGREGQWDRQNKRGIIGTLQAVSAPDAGQVNVAYGQKPASAAGGEAVTQGAQDPSTTQQGQFRMRSPGEETYDDKLQKRAWGMFPGAGSSQERAEWLAKQEGVTSGQESALAVAKARGPEAAAIRAQGGVDKEVAHSKGALDVQKEKTGSYAAMTDAKERIAAKAADIKAAIAGDKLAMEKVNNERKIIGEKRRTGEKPTPEELEFEKRSNVVGQQAQSGAPQQQSAPQQQAAPKAAPAQGNIPEAPPDPAQRRAGQQYRSKSGKVGTWDGSSWQQVR